MTSRAVPVTLLFLLLLAGGAVFLVLSEGSPVTPKSSARVSANGGAPRPVPSPPQAARPASIAAPARVGRPAVGLRVLRLVDHSRSAGATGPRVITTLVRYPAVGPSGAVGLRGAPALTTSGPFPLIVFGHGFSVTPAPYSRLLDAWARAGFVVAAPVFPLENANAPGGPDEHDLVNQPGDMSFVISRLLMYSATSTGTFSGLIRGSRVAVAGQSDGGDTALATAYDPAVRDRRVRAAVILSGAEDPFRPDFAFLPNGPPLLATQGTADTVNPPSLTNHFFAAAGRPKFLLELPGAGHQAPYTEPGPELMAIERATIGFLKLYLKGDGRAFGRDLSVGTSGAGSLLRGEP